MNIKEIKDIITLMNENDLTEIEIEREGAKIKIKKASFGNVETFQYQSPKYYVETQPASSPAAVTANEPEVTAAAKFSNNKEIKSPMVGTFYRAPSPESPPFVDVGQIVEVGQVVCIVEAMKLMNEIKSEVRGKIVEIPIANAQPVEFGQTLFVIEPV